MGICVIFLEHMNAFAGVGHPECLFFFKIPGRATNDLCYFGAVTMVSFGEIIVFNEARDTPPSSR
jgi:hypothetical protein